MGGSKDRRKGPAGNTQGWGGVHWERPEKESFLKRANGKTVRQKAKRKRTGGKSGNQAVNLMMTWREKRGRKGKDEQGTLFKGTTHSRGKALHLGTNFKQRRGQSCDEKKKEEGKKARKKGGNGEQGKRGGKNFILKSSLKTNHK